ncbi:MAG TPA: nuclear transport factor 2 family protein [Actinophytocola sp.]|uniref:YybH family protein n=1 Tax=Actinophytocola sp. TaxID=1872138 RepID=UPI002DDDA965|nr:nuclear transport factor 2 family protein [Actinophytocola sp.]HEV2781087.1 nuclear transport factor 2 family protein [Actinophytocola sp.]
MDHTVRAFLTRFNEAVRTGDWAGFAEGFTEDAVVQFMNVPVPALCGREAVEAGYREAPPDDTITAIGCRSDGDVHEVTFRWDAEGAGGGRLRLTMRDGLVAHSVVTLTQEVASSA